MDAVVSRFDSWRVREDGSQELELKEEGVVETTYAKSPGFIRALVVVDGHITQGDLEDSVYPSPERWQALAGTKPGQR